MPRGRLIKGVQRCKSCKHLLTLLFVMLNARRVRSQVCVFLNANCQPGVTSSARFERTMWRVGWAVSRWTHCLQESLTDNLQGARTAHCPITTNLADRNTAKEHTERMHCIARTDRIEAVQANRWARRRKSKGNAEGAHTDRFHTGLKHLSVHQQPQVEMEVLKCTSLRFNMHIQTILFVPGCYHRRCCLLAISLAWPISPHV